MKQATLLAGIVLVGLGMVVVGASSTAAASNDLECENAGEPGVTCIYESTEPVADTETADADGTMTVSDQRTCQSTTDCEGIADQARGLENFAGQYEGYYAGMYVHCQNQQP